MLDISSDSSAYNNGEHGSCYAAAFQFMLSHSDDEQMRDIWLCHGVVTGSDGGEAPGERILHAWCEVSLRLNMGGEWLDTGFVLVIDASNPDRSTCVVPRQSYYEAGEVCPESVRRYRPREAFQMGCKTGHCGRWERPLEDVDESLGQGGYYDEDGLFHVGKWDPVEMEEIEEFQDELRSRGLI